MRRIVPITAIVLAALLAPAIAGPDAPREPVTALLIVDIQEFYFPGGALPLVDAESASRNAERLLARFRESGRPVFHVGHNASQGTAFHASVQPVEGEEVVYKDEVNSFLGTDLLERLKTRGIERLVVIGMQTHMCLEGAVRAAHDYGFEVVVVADACATRDLERGDTTIPAAAVHAATLATLDRSYARVIDTEDALGEF